LPSLRLRGEVCKLVENPCVGVILSLTHTVAESRVYMTIFVVVVPHAHTHTHIMVHTRQLVSKVCLLITAAYIYICVCVCVLSRLCSVIAVVHVQKELLPCRPL
jgi:hypothetical protein